MKRVLWISRHQMTKDQREDLVGVLGDEVELIGWPDTVEEIGVLDSEIQRADVVAAVLPTQMLAQLLPQCGDRPLIQATSRRVATGQYRVLEDGREEQEFRFVHAGWQRICRLEMELEDLSQVP